MIVKLVLVIWGTEKILNFMGQYGKKAKNQELVFNVNKIVPEKGARVEDPNGSGAPFSCYVNEGKP